MNFLTMQEAYTFARHCSFVSTERKRNQSFEQQGTAQCSSRLASCGISFSHCSVDWRNAYTVPGATRPMASAVHYIKLKQLESKIQRAVFTILQRPLALSRLGQPPQRGVRRRYRRQIYPVVDPGGETPSDPGCSCCQMPPRAQPKPQPYHVQKTRLRISLMYGETL
jgi:hypothetical protein